MSSAVTIGTSLMSTTVKFDFYLKIQNHTFIAQFAVSHTYYVRFYSIYTHQFYLATLSLGFSSIAVGVITFQH